jgi:hypothetical protein
MTGHRLWLVTTKRYRHSENYSDFWGKLWTKILFYFSSKNNTLMCPYRHEFCVSTCPYASGDLQRCVFNHDTNRSGVEFDLNSFVGGGYESH